LTLPYLLQAVKYVTPLQKQNISRIVWQAGLILTEIITKQLRKENAIQKNNKKYSCLLLDPPWDIEQKGGLGAINHYQLMTIDRIKALPVPELLTENAHVWIWTTAATLEKGYEILRGWGLTPRSIFIWIKPRMGLGVYLRNCCEFIILATKGKAPIEFKAQMNYGFFPLQEHSHKPEEVHKIIERCSPGPNRLEMFARRRQHGWDYR
jgi:N6-adenosine-specific RNA methylase IME4